MSIEIIAFDDDPSALDELIDSIKKVITNSTVHDFSSSNDVIEFTKKNKVDVAFLDIRTKGISGIELAKVLKETQSNLNIIFVTGYSEYAMDAFSLFASGYVLKPVSGKKILDQINNLRNPVNKDSNMDLRIQTFGNFQVFYKDQPLYFSRNKARELLAYLVYRRGAGCSSKEIAAVLFLDKFYDRSLRNQVQTIMVSLTKTLADIGKKDVLIKNYNSLSIDTEKVYCDYFEFLKGNLRAINSYSGEFMTNYDWAEFVVGYLDQKSGWEI